MNVSKYILGDSHARIKDSFGVNIASRQDKTTRLIIVVSDGSCMLLNNNKL
jgi:hypothetical protein